MPRVKGGTVARRRRKKTLKLAKGYFGSKHLLFRTAKEQVMKSYMYAYRDRRQRKRDFRKLWISRINAATRIHGMSYSTFMYGLKCSGVEVNRKMLSEIAIHDDAAFVELVKVAQAGTKKGTKPVITGAKPVSSDSITISVGKDTAKETAKLEKKAPTKKTSTAKTEKATAKPAKKTTAKKTETKIKDSAAKTTKKAPVKKATTTAKKTATKTTADKTDYNKMTVAELKAIAKAKDIKIPAGSKKDAIIALLK